jgi:hypothetical protein
MKRISAYFFLLVLAPLIFNPAVALPADVYSLSGAVTIDGVPMNGWIVGANEVSDANQGNRTNTDTNGNYGMGLFPGTYRIWVEGSYVDYWGGTSTSFSLPVGYPGAQNLVVSGDATQNISVTAYTLTGRVMDTNGQGIPDVVVSISSGGIPYWQARPCLRQTAVTSSSFCREATASR